MMALVRELYPLCRSITGPGIRRTLARLSEDLPLETRSVMSGTNVLDWQVPDEWTIHDAYIKNTAGERVVDFRACNLHVVSYSEPVHARMSLAALRPHLHTLPEQPDLIPYRTSYYRRTWGFCLTQRQLEALPEETYEVCIDSRLAPGELTYGELLIPGQREDEILFSAHICHPSLANDNLSAVAVLSALAQNLLAGPEPRYSYRFLFMPGTIGAICWLAQSETQRIKAGLVVAGVGDAGALHYKASRRGNTATDRLMRRVLSALRRPYELLPWEPYGYDERQFCSPGFDLPVGRLSRTPYAQYPEYHTSADTPDFISGEALAEALELCRAFVAELEASRYYRNTARGEPQLGRRGLYGALGDASPDHVQAILWTLSRSDGEYSLRDVAEEAALPLTLLERAAAVLLEHGLLEAC